MEVILIVGLGGAIGAILRWGVSVFFEYISAPGFWGTLSVNLVGSFLIGLLFILFENKYPTGGLLRTGILVGVLGGFTTYSAFSMEVVHMMASGFYARAGTYVVVTLTVCLAGTLIGTMLGRSI